MKIPVWIVVIFYTTTIFAVQDFRKTPDEAKMCQKRVHDRTDHKNPDWAHMHHYCDGLRFYERAVRTRNDEADFKYNISNSLDGFDYVLSHTTPTFSMRAEVLVMRGRTLELAGRGLEAATLYNQALASNPDFSMAYAALGDFYAKTRDKEQALRIYAEGLRRHPNNRYLRARYQALGRKSSESQ